MKKTVGVLSLIVMLLSQVFTPFTYAVSGEEVPMPEPVVEEQDVDPVEEVSSELAEEVQQPETEVVEGVPVQEPGDTVDEGIEGDNNMVVEPEVQTGVQSGIETEISSGDIEQLTGGEKNLEEENSDEIGTGKETSFIETIKDFFGIGDNKAEEEKFESKEIYGTGEYEGVKVEVYAQTGLFASGTELTIEPVIEDKLETVQEVLLSGEVDLVEEQVIAFDITFRDPETQEELQPKDGTVQVKFNYEDNESLVQAEENEEQEVKVYHLNDIDEEGNKIEELTGTTVEEVVVNEEESGEDNVMVVDAESFSVYTIVVRNTSNQEIQRFDQSYEDLIVYIIDSNGNSSYYTIMDRNLGATQVFNQDYDNPNVESYGYHYQWGNNYGFESCLENGCTDFPGGESSESYSFDSSYFPGSFANNKWNLSKPLNAGTSNAWGGDTSSLSSKKGPCPTNYHIPSYEERNDMYTKWKQASELTDWKSYSADFLLPAAGYRNPSKVINKQGEGGYYQTYNQRYAAQTYVNRITNGSINADYTTSYDGYSMRCFKNTSTFNLQVNLNGGKNVVIGIDGNIFSSLGIPQKDNSVFKGWFTDDNFTELVEKGDSVSNLYAKWECKLGYKEIGTQCVIDDGFIVKFHPNGGYFSGMDVNSFVEVDYQWNGDTFIPNNNVQIPNKETENSNIMSGWMFAGWYTKSGENDDWGNEFSFELSNSEISNGLVYAKWLPFNDLQIKDGGNVLFTIMDRNLGAEMTSQGGYEDSDLKKIGYYYQWGNNFGFSNNNDDKITISSNKVDAGGYGPNNYYYSFSFIIENSQWDSSSNRNLWGGTGDTLKTRGEGTDKDRQGPCPDGYHVPSSLEWRMAYNAWNNSLSKSIQHDSDAKNFAMDFKLPYAGLRYYDDYYYDKLNPRDSVVLQGTLGEYWSSSSINNRGGGIYFNRGTVSLNSDDSQSYGYSVRCFKNTLDKPKKLIFLTETGNKILEYDLKWYESITSDYTPENPQKEGYEFIGWYESGSNEEYDFSQDRVSNLSLYEKWVTRDGEEGNTAKLLDGKRFNSVIKSLVVGDIISYDKQDTLIQGIERSLILPEGGSKRLISSEDSESQIFAWFDGQDKKIKYYTKAETIYLNEDSSHMFYNIRNLKPFNLNDFKFDYVTNMERMFAYSFSAAEGIILDFRNLNLTNVSNMKQAFEGCFQKADIISGVTIDFRNTDLSSVTNMYHMFEGIFRESNTINGITIDFSNADLSNVTDMNGMFEYSIKQASNISNVLIDFSNAKLGNVKDMRYMFNSMLQSVTRTISGITINLNNINLKSIEDMRYMFEYSFEYNNGIQAISGVTINIKNSVIEHEADVDQMFQNMFYQNYGSTVDGVKFDFSNSNLNGWKNLTAIFRSSFQYNGIFSGLVIDFSNVKMNKVLSMDNMFENAFSHNGNLKGFIINFDNTEASSLTSISKMFYQSFQEAGDISGVMVNFDSADLDNLENMKEMFSSSFSRSRSVNGITIDFGNLSLKNLEDMSYIFSYSFQNVQSLNCINIDFNNKNFVSLTNMSKMFVNAFYSVNTVSGINIDFSNSFLGNVINMDEFFSYTFYDVNIISGVTIDFSNTDLHNLTSISNLIYDSFRRNSKNSSLISDVKLDFSNVDFSSVTNVQHLFYGTFQSFHSMTGIMIDFSNTDLSSVKNAKWMFQYSIGYSDSIDNVIMDFSNVDLSSLTSANQMFYQTFYNITDVGSTMIKFDNINMHNITDMYGMFYRGEALKWLDLSSFDTSNVTDMTYMFYDCSNLTGLDLSSFDTSNVTKMPYMFQDDYNLKTIYVGSRFRTNNVTDSSAMFQNANSLVGGRGTTYDSSNPSDKTYARVDKVGEPGYFTKKGDGTVATLLPGQEFNAKIKTMAKGSSAAYGDADVYIKRIKRGTRDQLLDLWLQGKTYETLSTTYSEELVNAWYDDATKTIYYYTIADEIDMNTNASNMFSNLTKLEEVELEGINTNSVSNMTSLFQNDTSLTGMDLGNFDASSVTNMQNMFNGCGGLKSVNLSNANMSRVTNITGIFGGCSNLESVDFSNADISSLTSFASIFPGLLKLREVNFHKVNLNSLESTQSMFGGISSLKYADFSDANLKRVQTTVSMFGGSGLTGADFSNADLRNTQSTSSMFGGLDTLLMANFENTNMMNVINMSSMFSGCNNLNRVTFSGSKMGNVTNMTSMFGGDSKLETVDFTKVNLSKLENMSSMFGGCSGLTGMDFSKMDLSRVTNMDGLFSAALKLESVNFGDNDFRYVTNMRSLFRNCGNLKELDITKFDTRNVTNMNEMFYGAAKLKTIYVGDNFKTDSVTDSTDMFVGAVALVGGNGTTYDENKIDKEYAVSDVEGRPGYFTNIIDKKYTITYHLEGGELTGERTIYTERTASYVLPKPTKEGYTFEGWIGSNGDTPEINVSLEGMKGDLEFTAKWKVIVPDLTPNPTPSGNTGGGGGGSSKDTKKVDDKTTEKEHGSADEKQKEKQETKQEGQEKEQTKMPEKSNTTNQTSTQQSSSSSKDNTTTVDPEIQSAYEWAYAHDVTTMPTLYEANPEGVVTRGHLAKMVVNYATNVLGQEIPEKIPSECRWNDWRGDWESEEIKDYAVKSCALGLMGLDMDKFLPNMQVTRAQFGTIMSRLLWGKRYAGGTPYYRKHLNALKEHGIMTQIENPERRVELRQWVWLMLMRSAQNK